MVHKEKRKRPRIPVKMVPIDMKIHDDEDKNIMKGVIKGISEGGVGIETENLLSVGDVLELEFMLSKSLQLHDLRGKVVRVVEAKLYSIVGIQFMDIDEEREKIGKYINKKLQEKNNDNIISQDDMIIFK